jgi:Uma2 family endonuclease
LQQQNIAQSFTFVSRCTRFIHKFNKKIMVELAEEIMTVDEFLELDFEEGYIYELLNGDIMRRTSPNLEHQEASANLHFSLMSFIKPNKLGKIYAAPMDVYLSPSDLVVPDLVFVAAGNPAILKPNKCIVGVPDLIVEILSKGTQGVDRGKKMRQYRAAQVPEYWIVDPRLQSIEVYEWTVLGYELMSEAEEIGEVVSKILPDFKLEIATVFG